MTATVLALVPEWGLWLFGLTTFLSCLALPVPASLVMLAGGAFAAAGDLSLYGVALAALGGATAGDQAGFLLGRRASGWIYRSAGSSRSRAALLERAQDTLLRRGSAGVFLSRWLFSPLGPYVNAIGGAMGLDWPRFTIWAISGEIVWVGLYTLAGLFFGTQIEMIADLAGTGSMMLAALVALVVTGRLLFARAQG